jgi:hypothetical protein
LPEKREKGDKTKTKSSNQIAKKETKNKERHTFGGEGMCSNLSSLEVTRR